MTHLISILVAASLLVAFLLLTVFENRRGVRFFAAFRYKLDSSVSRAGFLVEHIDWGAFTAHLTRTSLNTVAHDVAQGTLMGVRAAERNLTRAVSALRVRREGALPIIGEGKISAKFFSQKARPMGDIVRKDVE
jgi:hypothetical protein